MKPGDFYVGVIDLFSILLPGALLAGAIAILFPMPEALQQLLASEAAKWAAFSLAAYALGHFAFLISAALDEPYDKYRKTKWPGADDPLKPFKQVTSLRSAEIDTSENPDDDCPMNTFKWAKSVLMVRAPAALADVNRYEADSKFFRSMTVVLPIVGIVGIAKGMWLVLPATLLLAAMSFRIYAQQRFKSTEWAYQYMLVLGRLGELEKERAPLKSEGTALGSRRWPPRQRRCD